MEKTPDDDFAERLAIGFGMLRNREPDEQTPDYDGIAANERGVWDDEDQYMRWWEQVDESKRHL